VSRQATSRRRSGGHARRSRRLFRLPRPGAVARLPARGRLLAGLLLAAFVAAAGLAVAGPWLRVERVAYAGQRYTPQAQLDELVAPLHASPMLMLDTAALRDRVTALPTVASATVETVLPDELRVAVTEKSPAFVWKTTASLLVGAADGSLMSELPLDAELPPGLVLLPQVDDQRAASHELAVGGRVDPEELRIANRLAALDPVLIGSRSTGTVVRIADRDGFLLVSARPRWTIALGFFGLDPNETREAEDARFDAQLTAVRTLFATVKEGDVSWVDVRNPGKVYWKP